MHHGSDHYQGQVIAAGTVLKVLVWLEDHMEREVWGGLLGRNIRSQNFENKIINQST